MKRLVGLILSMALILTGCVPKSDPYNPSGLEIEAETTVVEPETMSVPEDYYEFRELSDPQLLRYVEDRVYSDLVSILNSDTYFIENVTGIYVSKEYLDEITYNSRENIYFGYSLSELEKQFQGKKYVFTTDDNGEITVKTFEVKEDIFREVIENVAVGTGTILLCVTVSSISGSIGMPAMSLIFAASAKTGTAVALSSGVFSSMAAGVVKGIQTNDFGEAIEAAAVVGSDGFKWGAITGVIAGGVGKAISLRGASLNGLTMNEAAAIQKDSGYPLDVIKQFNSIEQYRISKIAGLRPQMVNRQTALIRDIDLNYVDGYGRSNLQRMLLGKAPLDPSGIPYDLHHIGQKNDSTLAILTREEHIQGGNNKILHPFEGMTENPSTQSGWTWSRMSFWRELAEIVIQ